MRKQFKRNDTTSNTEKGILLVFNERGHYKSVRFDSILLDTMQIIQILSHQMDELQIFI